MARREKGDGLTEARRILKNISGTQLIFNLPHVSFCSDGLCACETREQTVHEFDHRTREHTPMVVERKICASLSLLIGESLVVDPRVFGVADIAAAIAGGSLVVL